MALVDKRELIILRLMAILAPSNTGAETVVRNRALLSQDARPAIALLDGSEVQKLTGARRGRVSMSPQLMIMTPQIFYLPTSKLPLNTGIGEDVNAFRIKIIEAVAGDAELIEILEAEGDIALVSVDTDLKSGGLLLGQARLDFAITYVLDPYP